MVVVVLVVVVLVVGVLALVVVMVLVAGLVVVVAVVVVAPAAAAAVAVVVVVNRSSNRNHKRLQTPTPSPTILTPRPHCSEKQPVKGQAGNSSHRTGLIFAQLQVPSTLPLNEALTKRRSLNTNTRVSAPAGQSCLP